MLVEVRIDVRVRLCSALSSEADGVDLGVKLEVLIGERFRKSIVQYRKWENDPMNLATTNISVAKNAYR